MIEIGQFKDIILIIIAYGIVEFIAYSLVSFVNKKFQWLIIQKDEFPTLSTEGLKKFFHHGYDSELGWVRKPNTSHTENGKEGKTKWNIGENGARINPGFEQINSKISCYGDSFTFCRQVNDDKTWEYFLSKLQQTNVLNFGVGNYGIDQSLLRLKREYLTNKTPIVILAVVPDTISRILSVWKHYYEYGNTFGFKPRFIIKNNNLELIKNPLDSEAKFYDYKTYLEIIKKYDYFYTKKFKKEKIHFPYTLTLFKNPKRNFLIIYWVLKIQFTKKLGKKSFDIEWNPMQIIMKINLKWRINLFKKHNNVELLKKTIEDYVLFSKQQQFKAIFMFLPQKDDLGFIKKNYNYYEGFIKDISNIDGLFVVDITKNLLKVKNLDELYSDSNEYGGHFSAKGNEKIACLINEMILDLK